MNKLQLQVFMLKGAGMVSPSQTQPQTAISVGKLPVKKLAVIAATRSLPLVTDIAMPERSGFEVGHFALGLNPNQKILYISAFVDQFELEGLASNTMFLPKPFSLGLRTS